MDRLDLAAAAPGLYIIRCTGERWDLDLREQPPLLRRLARRQFPLDAGWGVLISLSAAVRDPGVIAVGKVFSATWTASAFPGPQRRASEPVETIDRIDEPDLISLDSTSTGTGPRLLQTHPASICAGDPCCIHNPSDHHMRQWPLNWRADTHLMERVCPEHGVGHPDPDDLSVRSGDTVHGCCGCCIGAYAAGDRAPQ